jgi:hypothetical protein
MGCVLRMKGEMGRKLGNRPKVASFSFLSIAFLSIFNSNLNPKSALNSSLRYKWNA